MMNKPTQRVWFCKIGVLGALPLPPAADEPMRDAVERAFRELSGVNAQFCFSGWGQELTEPELAVVENRLPNEEHLARHRQPDDASAWLIERRAAPPQWSTVRDPTGVGAFYSDPHRAHRFATKHDAELAMRRMSISLIERSEYFVSEHKWIDRKPDDAVEMSAAALIAAMEEVKP